MALPSMDLDDITYTQLVREARKRIPVYTPDWTDHNAHDPGITLIELFAWLTEIQIYRLNRVTDQSKWKFLRLMGIVKKETGSDNEDKPGDEAETPEPGSDKNYIDVLVDEVETLEQGILKAREKFRTVYRAVTASDYETLARQTPGGIVARAKAIPGYHPNSSQEVHGIVTLVVVPEEKKLDTQQESGFLKTVYRHMEESRLLTTELFIILPEYVQVWVDFEITVKPQYEGTKEKATDALRSFLSPLKGGPDRNGWPFGRTVYRSELYQVIDGVKGVDHVTRLKLKKESENDFKEKDITIPRYALVRYHEEEKENNG